MDKAFYLFGSFRLDRFIAGLLYKLRFEFPEIIGIRQ